MNQAVSLNASAPKAAHGATEEHACTHTPACPVAAAADHEAAVPVASHPEQGWSLLCNGVVMFDDTGELLPDGSVIAPRRLTDVAVTAVTR